MRALTPHLTDDDLDAFHSGALGPTEQLHIETCARCQALLAADRELMAAFERLPSLAPSDGFADRVMAQVAIAKPATVPIISFPAMSKRRAAVLVMVAAGMAASALWSVAFRPELDALLGSVGNGLSDLAWRALRAVAAGVTELPWYDAARAWLAPSRLAPGLIGAVLLYGSGVLALRKLLTPTTASATGVRA